MERDCKIGCKRIWLRDGHPPLPGFFPGYFNLSRTFDFRGAGRSRRSNINGKFYAMNAITPMKPWKTWVLKAIFFVLGHVKPLQKDLIDLSFIEFARWVSVRRQEFPYFGNGQAKEDLKYDYLLFFSNFNGTDRKSTRL